MIVDDLDKELLAMLTNGLPLAHTPYADVARQLNSNEADVFRRLHRLVRQGVVARFGVVVRHRDLGFEANAMAVWDIPDSKVVDVGQRIAAYPFVTLCYQRPRCLPAWPYNMFCMIHGRDRATVLEQIGRLNRDLDIGHLPQAVLFSRRRFKQRGAIYRHAPREENAPCPARPT